MTPKKHLLEKGRCFFYFARFIEKLDKGQLIVIIIIIIINVKLKLEVKRVLIRKLGQTRTALLESFSYQTDDQLNQKVKEGQWSIAQVVHHLSTIEKETAQLVLQSLKMDSKKVENRDLQFLLDRSKKAKSPVEPPNQYYKRCELIQLLEESRFRYLQAIFNETHEKSLENKSIYHPGLGEISVKNAIDFIWLHELRHIEQISEISQQLQNAKN